MAAPHCERGGDRRSAEHNKSWRVEVLAILNRGRLARCYHSKPKSIDGNANGHRLHAITRDSHRYRDGASPQRTVSCGRSLCGPGPRRWPAGSILPFQYRRRKGGCEDPRSASGRSYHLCCHLYPRRPVLRPRSRIRSVLARTPRALRKARIVLGWSLTQANAGFGKRQTERRAHNRRSAPWPQASAGPAQPTPQAPLGVLAMRSTRLRLANVDPRLRDVGPDENFAANCFASRPQAN
jgi:hypothetical protein